MQYLGVGCGMLEEGENAARVQGKIVGEIGALKCEAVAVRRFFGK